MVEREQAKCAVCGSQDAQTCHEIPDLLLEDRKTTYTLCRCSRCSLEFYNPRIREEDIHRFYPPRYSSLIFSTSKNPLVLFYKSFRYRTIFKSAGIGLKNASVLEIGCSRGQLLEYARERGAAVAGVEVNKADVNVLKQKNIPVEASVEALRGRKFDIILLEYVLEHLYDPGKLLRDIPACMNGESARLIASFPVTGSFTNRLFGKYWREYDAPRHIYLFSLENAERLFNDSGLEIIKAEFLFCPWVLMETVWYYFKAQDNAFLRALAPLFSLKNLPFLFIFSLLYIPIYLLRGSDRVRVTARKK